MRRFGSAMAWPPALLAMGLCAGCAHIHGRPGPDPEVMRPEQELHFAALYRDNCSGCHGDNGKNGAAISLANPVYVALAKDHIRDTITKGVPGHLMPAFSKSAGGMLTDQQVGVIADGIIQQWGDAGARAAQNPPPYMATLTGDAQHGQQAYAAFCARCHGANGEGGAADAKIDATASGSVKPGSIVDASFLALLSDQNLRSITIAGRPDQGMPDWRSAGAQPMTDQQVTDIVAWLVSKRVADPGQPYATRPDPHTESSGR
jgi:mono/diheme cytochrome c family protein